MKRRIIIMCALLAMSLAAALAAPDAPVITTRWLDGQRIEICTAVPGALYVAGAWAWIGDVGVGCRAYPPPDALIDAVYAPEPGKRYCLLHSAGLDCADALPRPLLPRTWLPIIAK